MLNRKKGRPTGQPKISYFPEIGTHTVPVTTRVLTPGTTVHAPVAGLRV